MKVDFDIKSIPLTIKHFFCNLKERGIFCFWIAGLLIFSILLWSLTGKLRSNVEIKASNKVLKTHNEKRFITSPISAWMLPGRVTQAGNWYLLSDNNVALIFTIPAEGIFAPYLAIFNDENNIDKIYPLSITAQNLTNDKNLSLAEIWAERVTEAAHILYSAR